MKALILAKSGFGKSTSIGDTRAWIERVRP